MAIASLQVIGANQLISMIPKIIHDVHKIMLSEMMEWCSSYRTMVLTMWLCLIAMLYVFFVFLFKTLRLNTKEKGDALKILCKAIVAGDIVKCVQLLEEHPHSINKYTGDGYTPFLIACANGNTQLVKLMLKKGADVRLKSLRDESAFYLATFHYIKYPKLKNASCIRELYYAGADINEGNEKCLTPLQMAAMFGHTALAKWLLLKNASVKTIPDPYIIASTQGHQETARVIWKHTMNFTLTYK